ncbi:RES family NAD+ phosphorylase [Alicycliphilus denitrificans]|uniref:RES family NAD+ phosphorylase n=1 Tax=Alicycliphilus denitrificans TaxID=179636 RepID=UPI003850DAAC
MAAWRGVEAQHVVSTLRLVDTVEEQDLLEQMLEGSKPALPESAQPKHYLLSTPFRYSPAHQSRFRPANAKGQWYGAQSVYGACAEVAYWRHRFILDSAGLLEQVLLTEHSIFQGVLEGESIDLMGQPWVQARSGWTHGSNYGETQAVAAEAQRREVQWLSYESVRAPGERCAVAFDVNCLYEPKQSLDCTIQRWVCKATRSSVMFTRDRESYVWDF